jgi:hypothetical protein
MIQRFMVPHSRIYEIRLCCEMKIKGKGQRMVVEEVKGNEQL